MPSLSAFILCSLCIVEWDELEAIGIDFGGLDFGDTVWANTKESHFVQIFKNHHYVSPQLKTAHEQPFAFRPQVRGAGKSSVFLL